MELMRLANGGGLAGCEEVTDDSVLGVFQWYHNVALRLRSKDRKMVDDTWLPKFSVSPRLFSPLLFPAQPYLLSVPHLERS